jgi:hypothetical protein
MTAATLTLPFPANRSYTVNVVDGTVTGASKILVALAGAPDTAENDGDSLELFSLSGVPKAGSIDFKLNFLVPAAGSVPINYMVA